MSSQTSRHQSSVKRHDLRFLTQTSSSPLTSNPSTPLPQITDPSGPLTPDTVVLVNPFASSTTTTNKPNNQLSLPSIRIIGEYELSETKFDDFKCARHIPSGEALLYKEYPLEIVRQRLEPYQRLSSLLLASNTNKQLINSMSIQQIAARHNLHFFRDILSHENQGIVLYPNYSSNLHTYITEKHRLNENESRNLFSQIIRAIQMCHQVGLIIRDLKLRKIIFNNSTHSHLLLTGLDEAIMLPNSTSNDDFVSSRFSCPVYACPEIVLNRQMYSGKLADSWSLGKFNSEEKSFRFTPKGIQRLSSDIVSDETSIFKQKMMNIR
jgi:serine/threonine protein kinase